MSEWNDFSPYAYSKVRNEVRWREIKWVWKKISENLQAEFGMIDFWMIKNISWTGMYIFLNLKYVHLYILMYAYFDMQ